MEVLLLTKPDKWGVIAGDICRSIFGERNVRVETGNTGDRMPDGLGFDGKVLLSFLCPWVIPAGVIDSKKLAINFHPGPSEYPGIGCYNFAIYDDAREYGVVAHHMAPQVDTGPIIIERRFEIGPGIDVAGLKTRSVCVLLDVFHLICTLVSTDKLHSVHGTNVQWKRKPYTRADLERLGCLTDDMTTDEALRRIRAMVYPGMPGAYIEKHGHKWQIAPTR